MRLRAQVWVMMALAMVLAGCMAGLRTAPPIYQDDSLTVRLEPNPAGNGQVQEEKGAQAITVQQLADVLRGLEARKVTGIIQSAVGLSEFEPVFSADELWLVAREIQKGLRQASSQERVAFQIWRPRGKGREETRGSIYLRGRILYVTLSKFRVSNRMNYEGAEGGSGKAIELLYEPSEAVVQRQQGFASRWLGAEATEVLIDIRRVAESSVPAASGDLSERRPESSSIAQPMPPPPVAAPPKTETTKPFPSPPAVTVEALQQQVKDLAESNQALRAKLKQAQEGQEPSQSVTEELVRLRQELAETKQLLGEKVLELNRLKKKSE